MRQRITSNEKRPKRRLLAIEMARLIAALIVVAVSSTLTCAVGEQQVSVNRNFFDPGTQAGGQTTNGMFSVQSDEEKAASAKAEKLWGLVSAVVLGLLAFKIAVSQ